MSTSYATVAATCGRCYSASSPVTCLSDFRISIASATCERAASEFSPPRLLPPVPVRKNRGSFSSAPLVPLTNKRMKLTAGPGLRPKRQTMFVPGCKDLKTSIENDRILGSSALLVVSTSCRSCPATSSYDRNVVMKYTIRLVVTHLLNHRNRAGPGHR